MLREVTRSPWFLEVVLSERRINLQDAAAATPPEGRLISQLTAVFPQRLAMDVLLELAAKPAMWQHVSKWQTKVLQQDK